ncbi:dephospho-CoA kinase [soil metagenome]
MYRVGITGGIGAGKSIVCTIFSTLGIPIYNADAAARRLMQEDVELKSELVKLFGKDAFDAAGNLNRTLIAKQVFNNEPLLLSLNAVVHPAVARDYARWESQHTTAPYTLREAAILFESGTNIDLNHIILVDAPEEIRIQRVKERDQRSEEEIKAIISRQWTSEKKKSLSDDCIINDDQHLVIPQVLSIHEKLISASV